ncbi:MAG: hypothetical protein LC737_04935 [Chloroflexi bacterium]|nr:hypothetical protein [Chloroflexota bacterium]
MVVPTVVPSIVLGVIAGTILAAVVHLIRGDSVRGLFRLWVAAQLGFWIAAVGAAWVRASLYTVGELQVVAGAAGSALAIALLIVTHRRL